MKNSVFISTNMTKNTGGGTISNRELEFLQRTTNVTLILANRTDLECPIPIKSINPLDHYMPDVNFLWDYLAQEYLDQHLRSGNHVDILFINGNPFGRTVEFFKNWNSDGKVIVDVPAHNLQESITEHEKFGVEYKKQYPHNVDEFLLDMQTWHQLQADIIICPSKVCIESLRKQDLVQNQKFVVIPHGVDIPDESELKPMPSQFRVGYAGSLGYDKGAFYLIQAWQNLGYKDAVLAYAGPHKTILDDPGLAPDGQKKGWIYRIPPFKGAQYKIFGWLPDLKELYDNISVYVQPSVTEGWGLEVSESMARGRPVIVSDACGAADMVTEGVDGFIFPSRDVNKLMELIDYCKNNPNKLAEMGIKAREKAKLFSWDLIQNRYQRVLE